MVVIDFCSRKSSFVYKATACPTKSTVLGSNPNFLITSLNLPLGSHPSCVFGLFTS